MKIERQKLCNRLACVCDRYKQRIIEKTIMLAEEYPTQSPSWECLLSFKKGLYIFNPETREVVPFHILIIEDEEALALAMEDLIRSIPNVFVKSVGTGGLALNTIPLGFWDVVLLDIKLPDMNGLDLLEKVKPFMVDTRFYVVSGYNSKENMERAKDLGAVDFIEKPFQPEQLIAIIESAVFNCD